VTTIHDTVRLTLNINQPHEAWQQIVMALLKRPIEEISSRLTDEQKILLWAGIFAALTGGMASEIGPEATKTIAQSVTGMIDLAAAQVQAGAH